MPHRAALPASKARLWRAWARSAANGLARNEASETMAACRFCSSALRWEREASNAVDDDGKENVEPAPPPETIDTRHAPVPRMPSRSLERALQTARTGGPRPNPANDREMLQLTVWPCACLCRSSLRSLLPHRAALPAVPAPRPLSSPPRRAAVPLPRP